MTTLALPMNSVDEPTTRQQFDAVSWARVVVALAARMVLLVLLASGAWAALPTVLGWQPTTVVTGSMQPRIDIGDVAVAMPVAADTLVPGRIVLFDDPDHEGRLRLHRLMAFDEQGLLVTKGDANPNEDSSHVDPAAVHGVGVLRVPWIGMPVVWWHEGRFALVGLVAAGVLALIALSGIDRRLLADAETPSSGPGAGDATSSRTAHPSARSAAVDVRPEARCALRVVLPVALAVALAAGSTPAWAAYRASTANPASQWQAAPYFTCSSAPNADNPYLYWKLDETSGTTLYDASGNGRDAWLSPGAWTAASGCDSNRALDFAASTYGVVGTSVLGPNEFTLELWMRTSATRGGRLLGFSDSTARTSWNNDRQLYLADNGTVVFGVYPGAVRTISSPTALNDGRWHHVVATLSTAGMRLYVDGQLVATDAATQSAQNYSGYWRVGSESVNYWPGVDPSGAGYVGTLDNVAVYHRALTASQVSGHYASRR